MHTEDRVGKSKVTSGKQFLQSLNSGIQIETIETKATAALLGELLPSVDVVLDCTDNFSTRHLINASCVIHQTPLVSGSALRFDGQISVFDPKNGASPCYACIFSPDESFEEVNCASMGIFSPLVGIIGAMQAAQALQLLIGFGEPLIGRMLLWNGRNTQIDEIHIARNPDCPVCGKSS
jgi:molybdopterin/thiamine biosynthesis adenylyltransferase